MTGQMIANKGGEDFLVAADAVRRRSPNARFVIGGPAEGTHFETLCSLTEKLALQGLVGFPGWLPSPSDFFAAIDLLVVPSRHEEGFGLVAAEAGEQGIPVVATRSGGITEIVLDRETGFIVDHNDPNALADRLVTLVQDEHLRNFLGQAGRKRIVEKFNLDVQVTEFQQFLKTVAR
jgi:glycosyltransferase involved in cell wall biosynthesis